MHICWISAIWGGVAGLSLPLGALVGVFWPGGHVSKYTQGVVLGLGAGFILYAVSIGIYGEYIYLMHHHVRSTVVYIAVAAASALVGAYGYIMGNHYLNEAQEEEQAALLKDHRVTPRGGSQAAWSSIIHNSPRGPADPPLKLPPAAIALYLGSFMDGIPEAVLIGFMATTRNLQIVFVLALFIANIPESLPSAAMLNEAGMAKVVILLMWCIPCVCMFLAAGAACLVLSLLSNQGLLVAVISGVAAGALLAMAVTVMIPEAYQYCGDMSGVFVLTGFLAAVVIQAANLFLHHVYGIPTKTSDITDFLQLLVPSEGFLRPH